jgi:uncharacterized protein involved in oxidation of intracellular sulfur
MKTGIIIYSNDPEPVWNAFRYANSALKECDEVKVFFNRERSRGRDNPYRKVSCLQPDGIFLQGGR